MWIRILPPSKYICHNKIWENLDKDINESDYAEKELNEFEVEVDQN